MKKSILLLINPYAGDKKSVKKISKIEKPFINNGFSVETVITENKAHLIQTAKNRCANFTHVAAVGGDGTLNAVLNACLNDNIIFVFIPAGTINIFAKEYKIPLNTVKAAKLLSTGITTKIDVIHAGAKNALLMVSAGLDSYTVDYVSKNKNKPGKFKYFFHVLKNAFKYTYPDLKAAINGKTITAKFILAGQTNKYAGYLKLLPKAKFNDGLLHVCAFKGKSPWAHLMLAIKSLFGIHSRSHYVEILKTDKITLTGPDSLISQMDGEQFAPLPLEISIIPDKVNFLIPSKSG